MKQDEMNLFVPQTLQSKAEALDVMNIKNCVISDQTSKPITGIVQDALVGIYLLTGGKVVVPKQLWNDAVFAAGREDNVSSLATRCEKLGVDMYGGRGLISVMFPEDFVFVRQHDGQNIEIQNGVLIHGQLNKDILSNGPNSIIQVMHRKYGQDVYVEFVSDIQRLANTWLQEEGFSLGYGDCLFQHEETELEVKKIIEQTKKRAMGKNTDPLLMLKQEAETNQLLNNSRNKIGKIVLEEGEKYNIEINHFVKNITIIRLDGEKILDHTDIVALEINIPKNQLITILKDGSRRDIDTSNITQIMLTTNDKTRTFTFKAISNPLKVMLNSKSKGTNLNISQIMGNIGQQNIGNKRIVPTLTNNTRVLPHFESSDLNPSARGFCSSGYLKGFDATEAFNMAMASREGLTDTAIKTAETGYLQRRMVKLMEDLITLPDGSVRNATGQIVQFQYGSNSFSTDRMVKVKGQITFTDLNQKFLDLPKRPRSKFAYVYFVNSDDSAKSTLVSLQSLHLSRVMNDIVVLFSPNASLNTQQLFEIRGIDSAKQLADRRIVLGGGNKYWALNLVEYEKILLVGSDMIFTQRNPDNLFQLNTPVATFSRYYVQPYGNSYNPYRDYQKHGDRIPAKVVLDGMRDFTALDNLILLKPQLGMNVANIAELVKTLGKDWYELHQIYQLNLLEDPNLEWLYGTKYTFRDAYGFDFYSDKYPWQIKDNKDVKFWNDIKEDLLYEYPEAEFLFD